VLTAVCGKCGGKDLVCIQPGQLYYDPENDVAVGGAEGFDWCPSCGLLCDDEMGCKLPCGCWVDFTDDWFPCANARSEGLQYCGEDEQCCTP